MSGSRRGGLARFSFLMVPQSQYAQAPDRLSANRPFLARTVDGGKQQSGDKREVIDEKPELRLIVAPMRQAMKGKRQKQDIGSPKNRSLGKERAGQKGDC